MRLAILIVIIMLGLLIPLFWILGTITAVPFLWRHARKERAAFLNPQLGLTMADGGDSLDKEDKKAKGKLD